MAKAGILHGNSKGNGVAHHRHAWAFRNGFPLYLRE